MRWRVRVIKHIEVYLIVKKVVNRGNLVRGWAVVYNYRRPKVVNLTSSTEYGILSLNYILS